MSRSSEPRRRRSSGNANGVRRRGRYERGQEIVELVLVLPFLLVMVFGILEFGHLFDVDQSLTSLSREGANIASRGTPLDTVVQVTLANGAQINLAGFGGAIASQLTVQNGVPMVSAQLASAGISVVSSRIGPVGAPANTLGGYTFADGKNYYIVELFYDYQPFTPLKRLVQGIVPDTIYDRAMF